MSGINLQELERMECIAADLKKEFTYSKHLGTWQWRDRGEPDSVQGPFKTRLLALKDAVEPYLPEDESDE